MQTGWISNLKPQPHFCSWNMRKEVTRSGRRCSPALVLLNWNWSAMDSHLEDTINTQQERPILTGEQGCSGDESDPQSSTGPSAPSGKQFPITAPAATAPLSFWQGNQKTFLVAGYFELRKNWITPPFQNFKTLKQPSHIIIPKQRCYKAPERPTS